MNILSISSAQLILLFSLSRSVGDLAAFGLPDFYNNKPPLWPFTNFPATSSWGAWSACQNGRRTRQRSCVNPYSFGLCLQSQSCLPFQGTYANSQSWSQWSAWSSCFGTRLLQQAIRTRTCVKSSLSNSPYQSRPPTGSRIPGCLGLAYQRLPCRLITRPGNSATSWSSWSDCNSNGRQSRGCRGLECPSNSLEFRLCEPRRSSWSSWSEWSNCIQGQRFRSRQCSMRPCQGQSGQSKSCSTLGWAPWNSWSECFQNQRIRNRECLDTQCRNGDSRQVEECSSLYTLSPWSTWSDCADNRRFRTRTCPSRRCEGDPRQFENCFQTGTWSPWSSWSTCVGNQRDRFRECADTRLRCDGQRQETSNCSETRPSSWSAWSTWSECNNLLQSRIRACLSSPCRGFDTQSRGCGRRPRTLGWSEWGSWSVCGGGVQGRLRSCFDEQCPGNSYSIRPCQSSAIRQNSYSQSINIWSQWSSCTLGVQRRVRQCPLGSSDCAVRGYQQKFC